VITVIINGKRKEIPRKMNVKELIEHLNYQNSGVAVAVNMTFVVIAAYEKTLLKEGDEVEILGPVQGG